MSDTADERPELEIDPAEAKQVLAIVAHLRQVFRTASKADRPLRPKQMDHGELLLAAASLRALFFDDGPASPILLSFLERREIDIQIDTLETNLGLILLSHLVPDDVYASDYLMEVLLNPEMRDQHPLNEPVEMLLINRNREQFRSVLSRPDVWVPSRDEALRTNSSLSHLSNVGPTQLTTVCRRLVPLQEWGRVRIGYLKAIPIDRRNIISYAANKLGGVHYDSTRLPSNKADASQFKVLATAYDWDNEAILHAGLVAVGLACLELVNCSQLVRLWQDLGRFHRARQDRLERGT